MLPYGALSSRYDLFCRIDFFKELIFVAMLGNSARSICRRLVPDVQKHFLSSAKSINLHNSATAAAPLIEHFRSRWPHTSIPSVPSGSININIPKQRTIPPSVLRFSFSATFGHGSSIYYSHLNHHPADLKVSLKVSEDIPNRITFFYFN